MKDMNGMIAEMAAAPQFREGLLAFLVDICAVDTTPQADPARMRAAEAAVYRRIRAYLGAGFWTFEERPIPARIQSHAAWSQLHFTKTAANPSGLPAEAVYAGRGNMLVLLDGAANAKRGLDTAIHAHVDVIAPYFSPVLEANRLRGRGAVDNKGNVAAICGALQMIRALVGSGRLRLSNRITAMFPVEEETGGNGSLALALDRELKGRYASIVIMECADGGVFPANRGAVWFRSAVVRKRGTGAGSLLEAVAYGVLAMQAEGAVIKAEAEHPLFPHRPVQTCNGILGPFGEHPSRISGCIPFLLRGNGNQDRVQALLEQGVARYVSVFGDKTQELDPKTGRAKVARHLEVSRLEAGVLRVVVYGSTGHMGAILQNDDAILKWAHLVRELVEWRQAGGDAWQMEFAGFDASDTLVLEGGQGFLPTHAIEAVQSRMAAAFERGVGGYLALSGETPDAIESRTTYDKLHNNAFACDPDSASMRHAREAAKMAGMAGGAGPIRGWDVSCDARLFAGEYPDLSVITAGIGELRVAHSNDEALDLEDLWRGVVFCTQYLLRETGSVPDEDWRGDPSP